MRASTDVVADQLDRDHQARTDGARQEHGRDETSGVPTETAADAGERLLTIKDKPVSCKTVGSAYEGSNPSPATTTQPACVAAWCRCWRIVRLGG
jgi:hypothetical protein